MILLAVFTGTRLALAAMTGLEQLPPSLWPAFLAKGLCFDALVVAPAVVPFCLYEALATVRWRARRAHALLEAAALTLLSALALFVAVAEAVFWLEFYTRFNFIAVDYLLYTHEVLGNIWESYPVLPILAAIALAAAGLSRLFYRRLRRAEPPRRGPRGRAALAAASVGLALLAVLASDVDRMRGLGNAFADELSGNGVMTFLAAMRRNELDYDAFYQTIPQEVADAALRRLGVRGSVALARRSRVLGPFRRRPRHVVLITVESLSASVVGAYGATAGLTPRFDALARGGFLFTRAFATGTRTVRGLEALSLGTPPVPGQAIVRRPGAVNLATLGALLRGQGYATGFFYGGYSLFDNMGPYFRANGYGVFDRRDFPRESVVFENIWGVADESLFDNVLRVLDRQSKGGKPFFAHVMTTSNHRPYTYPQGRIDIPSPGGRDGAIKYTDYAIGKFIDDARARPWFDDTLFVIVADHCAAVAGRTRLPIDDYHIPLLFYAPGLLRPGSSDMLISQLDLPPTLLDALGRDGAGRFFGRAAFAAGPRPDRAFVSNYQELGYLREGTLTVLAPQRRVESYAIDPRSYAATPRPPVPALLTEAIAYYQTAARAFKSGGLAFNR